ncbi:MAG: transcriptional regulator, BolA protein family [Proteobacteria bacterium]|nr:transcriptional regulator, BolA protein family [Pseudomonadota bacterium]
MERSERLRACLQQAFEPVQLDVVDDSRSHAGHSHGGGGHFFVTICSGHFEGRSPVERHRMVYGAVSEMMPQDIHALSIKAFTPGEASA